MTVILQTPMIESCILWKAYVLSGFIIGFTTLGLCCAGSTLPLLLPFVVFLKYLFTKRKI